MSATLVETFLFPAPHQILAKEPLTATTQCVSLTCPPQPAFHHPFSLEERYATQLAHLASQHHMSDYNRLKFGARGCPMTYVPLSIHMPAYVKELRAAQAQQAKFPAWFPCVRQQQVVTLGPCGTEEPSTVDLQEELSAAIDELLESKPHPHSANIHGATIQSIVKTSESHPINISTIVPPDMLFMISSHISPSKIPNSPVLFDIDPYYSLDRIVCQPSPRSPSVRKSQLSCPSPLGHAFSRPPPLTELVRPKLTRSPVSEALRAAINSGLAATGNTPSGRPPASRDLSTPVGPISAKSETKILLDVRESLILVQQKDKVNSQSAPIEWPDYNRKPSTQDCVVSPPPPTPPMQITPPSTGLVPNPLNDLHAAKSSSDISSTQPSQPPTPRIKLGNMLLSSCPGKKVRLCGPVKGRSTVRRDLDTDLRRMWEAGVRCIVCCLDDNELDHLGVPWPEYSQVAQDIGLEILRIPTPEGLPPTSPADLSAHLSIIITNYTLLGKDVLVHCRGGVGRAGVFAACWLLRLGFCGWIETEVRNGGRCVDGVVKEIGAGLGLIRRDTLQMVERAITVVRRRRSVKAVETYEQVKFLVEFVEFLREARGTELLEV